MTQAAPLTVEGIRLLLLHNPKAVLRGVLAIYERQTADEQSSGYTKKQNGIGFNGPDSAVMSRYAKKLLAGRNLMPHENADARERIYKYAGQLLQIALEKKAAKDLEELGL